MNHCIALWFCSALLADSSSLPCSEEWGKWGLAGLVVAYTLWRDYEREKRMASVINKHDEWVKEQMTNALRESAVVAKAVADTARETAAAAAAAAADGPV